MAVKLHRCSLTWFKSEAAHPCWRVENALKEKGIDYERVTMLGLPRSRRTRVHELTGQQLFPVIDFEDGSAYREESAAMAETIRAGRLDEKRGGAQAPAPEGGASG